MKTTDDLFREKPYLFWGISPKAKLSDRSKVCNILSYGDMDDVEILINHFFKLYFKKHAKLS